MLKNIESSIAEKKDTYNEECNFCLLKNAVLILGLLTIVNLI